uniref:4-coumarate--CoA ligase n=1 Tax=Chenopodium quinoa TaxID=63459 RepID=A0A803L686_CHEQI
MASATLFLLILHLGAIVTPMNPLSSFSEAKKQTLNSHAKLAFTLPENAEKLSSLGLKTIQVVTNVLIKETQNFPEFSNLIFGKIHEKTPFLPPKINQDDTAAILYSSGTSGASKGVMLTHRNLIATLELFVRFEASQYKEIMDHKRNVYLAVMPMFHVYGLALFGVGLISLGTSIVVMTKFDINEVVKVIDKFKVTHFPLVPPILGALTAKARSLGGVFGVSQLCSLKQVSCGAAPLTTKILADFLHTFPTVDFIQGYGMTETTAVGTRGFNAPGKTHKYTSIGLLAPNMEAKVVNCSTGSCMPPGKAGELLLRGPGIMKGYFNNAEATRQTIDENGWLLTGDIVYFDNDGYIYVIDRLKDIIKYKGFQEFGFLSNSHLQIAPADLETILVSHPEIADVAVTGVADDKAGEIPVAFVVKKPGSLLSRNDIVKYVADMVAPHKKVREVVFVNSIPKSVAGKVLRRNLKNLLPSNSSKL